MISDTILGNLYESWTWRYRKDGNSLPTDNKTETKKKIEQVLSRVSTNLESKIPSELKDTAYLRIKEELDGLNAAWFEEKDSSKKPSEKYNLALELKQESLKQGFSEEQSNALCLVIKKYLFNLGMDISDKVKLLHNGWDTIWLKKNL
ncbi:MAG: hypothetical protein KKA65_00805 [Nanoarchaeota archaeon]|nr:hypothetical protein [Nanoarchaeota archaeon]MBU4242260.1 hypothetical protein [Nanoarchaeota archaeon]MBU4352261.1 hypothetical protein [Nanoarchaeota archaeon]MBU4456017.1 hypothetical protein [Nanoarchaeota archaeon]MCG2719527.1 hypothetical protein [Nanoarchaeota archaeon]